MKPSGTKPSATPAKPLPPTPRAIGGLNSKAAKAIPPAPVKPSRLQAASLQKGVHTNALSNPRSPVKSLPTLPQHGASVPGPMRQASAVQSSSAVTPAFTGPLRNLRKPLPSPPVTGFTFKDLLPKGTSLRPMAGKLVDLIDAIRKVPVAQRQLAASEMTTDRLRGMERYVFGLDMSDVEKTEMIKCFEKIKRKPSNEDLVRFALCAESVLQRPVNQRFIQVT